MDSGDRVKTLVVEITPKPAARPRFCRGRAYTEAKYKAWQKECTALLQEQWDEPPLQHVKHIHYSFIGANRRCDIDNLVKSITDCMTYAKILRGDNLAVLDSISASYHHTKDFDPFIMLTIMY